MKAISRYAIILIAALGMFLSAASAQNAGQRARGLFTSGKSDGMRILILRVEGDKLIPADPGRSFQKGDQIRVSFESNFDGYVYVVNVTPGGKKRILFPYAKESDNRIQSHKRYELPTSDVFIFDEEKGTEILQVIMSREPIAYLDSAIKSSQGELGESASSAAAELSSGKPQKTGLVTENVSSVLPKSGPEAVRSRGIILAPGKEKDEAGSFVAIPDKPDKSDPKNTGKLKAGEAAVFEIRLQHI